MTSQPEIRIGTTGDLIAAIPALLGYRPSRSLVVIATRGRMLVCLANITLARHDDQDPAGALRQALDNFVAAARRYSADSAHLVAIGNGESVELPMPPTTMIEIATATLTDHGIRLTEAAWVPAIEHRARWRSYLNPTSSGVLPDPYSTVAAAEVVAAGGMIYRSRAELAESLRPDAPDALDRRARAITALTAATTETAAAEHRRLLAKAVQQAQHGILPDSDEQIAPLALALADRRTQHAAFSYCLGADAPAAIRLWSCLVRQLPGTYRAEPAVLLATTAHILGDAPLASVAIEAALDAQPEHHLALLLGAAFSLGLNADELATGLTETLRLLGG